MKRQEPARQPLGLYPPDLQDDAVKLVLRQAEALAQEHSQPDTPCS